MTEQAEKRSYKQTLNLPRTPFAMKANLVQNEPASMKRWDAMKLYHKLREARKGSPRYVFHDGPPYANGSIHLGHLLNKVLKDLVVRTRTMAGYDCPYIPGWDCHGLPIEHKVVEQLGDKAREMEPYQIRRKCQAYAEKFVKLQAIQMQRLLTLADYEQPYLTMHPSYEGASLQVFADLVERNLVNRALKPVHWSIANRTALADAELEYEDRVDTSVYVLFEVVTPTPLHEQAGLAPGQRVDLMIWTTTPWTLPANMAVAAAPRASYGLYSFRLTDKIHHVILADNLADSVLSLRGATDIKCLASCIGNQLADAAVRYRHPFIERTSPVVTAEYVTLEDGTGFVHTAPGHGVEDYQTGTRTRLRFSEDRKEVLTSRPSESPVLPDIYCPVLEDGTFDATVPDWLRAPGVDVWKANDLVVERLRSSAHLFHDLKFTHSYPHDWRSKTPVIFRATEQWFVYVDFPIGFSFFEKGGHGDGNAPSIRELAIEAVKNITFYPAWGRNRLRGMLDSRPDWCISRQRAWGLPIPAFFNEAGEPLLTAQSVRTVAALIASKGSDAWFQLTPAELLAGYDPNADDVAPAWAKSAPLTSLKLTKSTDIFDVWFDSGTSWASVIRQRGLGHDKPDRPITDLYLEGSDQHRGWFQASLLPAVATTGQPPYSTVLTHGFMVDKDGRKMSKSLGNTLEVEELLKEYGADVCRWWVSSLNTDNDIKVDESYFKVAGESYRKVRNTLRFMLSNLSDFDSNTDRVKFTEAESSSIDAWVLGELDKLVATVRRAYEEFDFGTAHELLFNFCNDTLSAKYLGAVKDRLYCDPVASPRRRRTQSALFALCDALARLLAPILPHTADEAWIALRGDQAESVHLEQFPVAGTYTESIQWQRVFADLWDFVVGRGPGQGDLERVRKERDLPPLDLGILLHLPANADEAWDFLRNLDCIDVADALGVSQFGLYAEIDAGSAASSGLVGASQWPGKSKWWVERPDRPTVEIVDLTQTLGETDQERFPRCERSWKRDGTVKQRSDGGWLSDRDAAAVGVE